MIGTFKIYSLSNFQIYNIVLLTVFTLLYIPSPGLIYFITGSLYFVTTFTHFAHRLTSTSSNHESVLCIYEFFFCFKISRISEIVL